ncbi:MAG: type IX secretion system sortase PorU [Bacteroidota bacterium]|nr:type IX secretion system sortase PorU [Bacteroidota bacterium]
MFKRLILTVALAFPVISSAQEQRILQWTDPVNVAIEEVNLKVPYFVGGVLKKVKEKPVFHYVERISGSFSGVSFINATYSEASPSERSYLNELGLGSVPEIQISNATLNGSSFTIVTILPFRRDPSSGTIQKLSSFELQSEGYRASSRSALSESTQNDNTNPLASGEWKKVSVARDGMYAITPALFSSMGWGGPVSINSIRIVGNGFRLLSEEVPNTNTPNLEDIPIKVIDQNGDGILNGSDKVVFFAQGPNDWTYDFNSHRFLHTLNPYRNKNYYFISINSGSSPAPSSMSPPAGNPSITLGSFDDVAFIDEDKYNLVGSGRHWYGDLFDFTLTYNYTFNFEDINSSIPSEVRLGAAGRSFNSGTSMRVSYAGNPILTSIFPPVGSGLYPDFARTITANGVFNPTGNSIQLTVTFNNGSSPSATAWLDYLSLQVRRNLIFRGEPLVIRARELNGNGGVIRFNGQDVLGNGVDVWDVTDFNDPRVVVVNQSSGNFSFDVLNDTTRSLVAFNPQSVQAIPTYEGDVPNQDLHSLQGINYVIVAHPDFVSEAQRLATFHQGYSGFTTTVVTPQQIYNEFSSGGQDIAAIREFMRHLYEAGTDPSYPGDFPRFLLMFGDASYDFKGVITPNHNYVPIYMSEASLNLISSYSTDDFYAMLDPGEGSESNMNTGLLDIGVGRFPVNSVSQARVAVDKSIAYASDPSSRGPWQNEILLVSDDVDQSFERDFMTSLENLDAYSRNNRPELNTQKVYADAYQQISLAGSQRYPDAREELFRKVQKGNLFTCYVGHGGEVGWAGERILQLEDVNGWTNFDNLPVFSTVTCEFTRWDDPLRQSAGEQLFLNPKGGSVALYSTTRSVGAWAGNYQINQKIFEQLVDRKGALYSTFGEVNQFTKNDLVGNGDRKRFSLCGDPALRLAIPIHLVETDSINGVEVTQFSDTLKALQLVTITGHIEDFSGQTLNGYSGLVYPTIYDKLRTRTTLLNDGVGPPLTFTTRDNVLYRGKVQVTNGYFKFSFVVPKDIDYSIGFGKLSYFSTNGKEDGTGYMDTVLIGGLDPNPPSDVIGPQLTIFLNDENFVPGGLTNPDPLLIVKVQDSSGVNTLGTGIGHDLVAILDGDVSNPFILNDYYESDLNSFQSGEIRYPIYDLEPGLHNLRIRVWDVYNNPAEGTIDFLVANDAGLALDKVLNWPNPFTTYTEFQFEHNRPGQPLDVQVQIFTVSGKLIKTINQTIVPEGSRVTGISWDGLDDFGDNIGKGVYVYRLKVRSPSDGAYAEKLEKLVILR